MRATPRALVLFIALVSYGCGRTCNGDTPRPVGKKLETPLPAALFVTNNGSDSVTIIDKNTGLRTDVSVDIDNAAHEAPHHLAVDVPSRSVYVALSFPAPAGKPPKPNAKKDRHAAHGKGENLGKLVRLSLDTLTIEESGEVDENPGDVILSHDARTILVTHFDLGRAFRGAMAGGNPSAMMASLQLWDPNPLKLRDSRNLCVAPHGIAITNDDNLAIVACYGSDELAIVDLHSLATARYPLGPSPGLLGAPKYGPYSATLSPDGASVLVAEQEGQALRVFDLPGRHFVEGARIPLGARAMIPVYLDANEVVVPLQATDGIVRVHLQDQSIASRRAFTGPECKAPHVAACDAGGRLFLVCEGDHVSPGSVLELDRKTLATLHAWPVGIFPDGIAFGDAKANGTAARPAASK